MTVLAVWARVTNKHHSTNFYFVPWVAYDWAKFLDAKSYILSSSSSSFLLTHKETRKIPRTCSSVADWLRISSGSYAAGGIYHGRPLVHMLIDLIVLRYLNGSPGKDVHIVKFPTASLEAFVD
ncbi:hypothetical protein Tco_0217632, partial [Tanacetum coccineum]